MAAARAGRLGLGLGLGSAPAGAAASTGSIRLGCLSWSSMALVCGSTSRVKYEVVLPSAVFLYLVRVWVPG